VFLIFIFTFGIMLSTRPHFYIIPASQVLTDFENVLAEKTALMEANMEAETEASILKDRIALLESTLASQQNEYDEAVANIEKEAMEQRQSFAEYEASQREKVKKMMETMESQGASIESQTRDLEAREEAIKEESDALLAEQEDLAERQRELTEKEAQLGEALAEGQSIAEEGRQLKEEQEQMRLVAMNLKEKSKEIEHERFLLDERISKAEEVEEELERWQEELNLLSVRLGQREAELSSGRI
jgi:DNA repair exonuclease SbcCD ATPase subunit